MSLSAVKDPLATFGSHPTIPRPQRLIVVFALRPGRPTLREAGWYAVYGKSQAIGLVCASRDCPAFCAGDP